MKRRRHTRCCIILATLLALGSPAALAEDEWAEEGKNEFGIYLGVTEPGALLRLGLEYGFGIGKGFAIAPGVAFDFTENEDVTIVGAVFSKKF